MAVTCRGRGNRAPTDRAEQEYLYHAQNSFVLSRLKKAGARGIYYRAHYSFA